MYDGQPSMVRCCCAVEWASVIDVGQNRIRRCCRNTPAYGSAFCSSCLLNRCTTKKPTQVPEKNRLNFINELQQMKYLKQGEYFIESVTDSRVSNNRRDIKVKWVGYPMPTWESISILSRDLRARLKTKLANGEPCILTVNEIQNDFFDDPDSDIFDTKAAKTAYSCNTTKDTVYSVLPGKRNNRVAALCIGVGVDGVVESIYESFRSESLSQLQIHRLHLTKRYPALRHQDTIVGYDDGCHNHAYVTNLKRTSASPEATIIASQTVIIDNFHLKGHTDPRCKKLFNPKNHPLACTFNTQIAEQTFAWFAKYKHIGRHMSLVSYWVFIIALLNERNLICLSKVKVRCTSKKRKRNYGTP